MFVKRDVIFPYTIQFENKPEATAPAQTVTITQQLDDDLDWSTFELGSFGFGDLVADIPSGRTSFATRVDAVRLRGVLVDFTAHFNPQTGLATWSFSSLDPNTLDVPADPFSGFLPPNLTAPDGDGFVSYRIRPTRTLTSGTRIDAEASVVFDTNAPIATDPILNRVDPDAPSSSVLPLPAQSSPGFLLKWAGTDANGSGIANYDIFVSDNGGPFTLWLERTILTEARFSGQIGHTYSFYSTSRDNVGYAEATPSLPDATTRIELSGELTADIVPILPASRISPVDTIDIVFNEPVAGFDKTDLSLSLTTDASADIPLTTAALTTDDGRLWTLRGLPSLTSGSGVYELRLIATESGIRDANNRTLSASASAGWIMRPGDADQDGVFGTQDLVSVFVRGEYEDNLPGNSTWSDGDWNNDGDMTSTDLVVAFQSGGFSETNPEFPRGDFNRDQLVNAVDIDLLFQQLRMRIPDSAFDVTGDNRVNLSDRDELIRGILKTTYGDANLDGVFNSKDLVQIFQAGQFEDAIPLNSTWETGDWNSDGDFGTGDLVLAFQAAGYTNAARAVAAGTLASQNNGLTAHLQKAPGGKASTGTNVAAGLALNHYNRLAEAADAKPALKSGTARIGQKSDTLLSPRTGANRGRLVAELAPMAVDRLMIRLWGESRKQNIESENPRFLLDESPPEI